MENTLYSRHRFAAMADHVSVGHNERLIARLLHDEPGARRDSSVHAYKDGGRLERLKLLLRDRFLGRADRDSFYQGSLGG